MKRKPPGITPPDSDLYIYYLEGRVPSWEKLPDEHFIGNWEEEGFSFLFFERPAENAVHRIINTYPPLKLLDSYHMTYEQWQGGKIEPLKIGRFLLAPPWADVAPEHKLIEITLDPGVVFGNGMHPTTRDCLAALEKSCAGKPAETMLDLGTGSGVLALAAIKLGCRRAMAVDFNFLAARTALENVHLNQMERRILVVNGRAEHYTDFPADLLVANIHWDIMQRLVRSEGFFRKKWFVLSGLLRSEAKKLDGYLANQPVTVLKRWDQGGIWHTFLGKTRDH